MLKVLCSSVFEVPYLLNAWMDLVCTWTVVRYWAGVFPASPTVTLSSTWSGTYFNVKIFHIFKELYS